MYVGRRNDASCLHFLNRLGFFFIHTPFNVLLPRRVSFFGIYCFFRKHLGLYSVKIHG